MYTSHGHHIGGTTKGTALPSNLVARCGGPKNCDLCFGEALAVNTQKQTSAGGSMFMSPYQMRQVANKMLENNPKPEYSIATRKEVLLSRTLEEFAKAMLDVADDIENGN